MSDIVERLRRIYSDNPSIYRTSVFKEAADEIERLRELLRRVYEGEDSQLPPLSDDIAAALAADQPEPVTYPQSTE